MILLFRNASSHNSMSSGGYTGVAVGAALFAASAVYAYGKISSVEVDKTTNQKIVDGKLQVRLMEGESKGMIRAPSINTITFYSGKVSKESVQAKVAAIVAANPWLLTRLINSKDWGDTCALFPPKFDPLTDSHDCFQFLVDSTISASIPYEDLYNKVKSGLIPMGTACIDKGVGQFKVTLIEIKPDLEYALVVSLSHVIGDGHTFYALYGMLDSKTPVQSLVYERRHEFTELARDVSGKEFSSWIKSAGVLVGVIRTMLGAPPKVHIFTVDRAAVEAAKKSHATSLKEGQFLSTNDILTSWFYRLCGSQYGMMPFNYRNKYSEYHDNMAGNYEGLIFYDEKGFNSPVGIRESLTTINQGAKFPTLLESFDFNVSVVTNWTSFYVDVHLEGAVQTMHYPLGNTRDSIFRNACIVFNTSKDTLAVKVLTRSNVNIGKMFESGDDSVKFLKDRII